MKHHGLSRKEAEHKVRRIMDQSKKVRIITGALGLLDLPFFELDEAENIPYSEDTQPCTEILTVRVPAVIKTCVQAEARKRGISASKWIRNLIMKELTEDEEG